MTVAPPDEPSIVTPSATATVVAVTVLLAAAVTSTFQPATRVAPPVTVAVTVLVSGVAGDRRAEADGRALAHADCQGHRDDDGVGRTGLGCADRDGPDARGARAGDAAGAGAQVRPGLDHGVGDPAGGVQRDRAGQGDRHSGAAATDADRSGDGDRGGGQGRRGAPRHRARLRGDRQVAGGRGEARPADRDNTAVVGGVVQHQRAGDGERSGHIGAIGDAHADRYRHRRTGHRHRRGGGDIDLGGCRR